MQHKTVSYLFHNCIRVYVMQFKWQKITQTEFKRLFKHDSIEPVNLNTNDKEAKIRIRPFHDKKIN